LGSITDIAGFSIQNNDDGGIFFDNLKYDVQDAPPGPPTVPEPTTIFLLGIGLTILTVLRAND
jgi:hypothetical protein